MLVIVKNAPSFVEKGRLLLAKELGLVDDDRTDTNSSLVIY